MLDLKRKTGIAFLFFIAVAFAVFTVSQVTAVTKDQYPDGSGNWWDYDQNDAYSASAQASVGKWNVWGGIEVSTFASAYCDDTYSDETVAKGKYTLTSDKANPPFKQQGFNGSLSKTLADEKKYWFASPEEVRGVAAAIVDLEGNNLEADRDVSTDIVIW